MIFRRAFMREVLHLAGAVGMVLLSIFLVVRVMGFLRRASEGDIPAAAAMVLLSLKTVSYLDVFAPLVLYIAALLVLGRWSRDNELTALAACGVGLRGLIAPALLLAALIGALTAAFSLYLSPLSARSAETITRNLTARAATANIVPGVFAAPSGGGVYFVERREARDDERERNGERDRERNGERDQTPLLIDVFAHHHGHILRAESARELTDPQGGVQLQLNNGARWRAIAGDANYDVLRFDSYTVQLTARQPQPKPPPLRARHTRDLIGGARDAVGELHWRLAKIVMPAVLMIFALGFSQIAHRQKRFEGMTAAFVTYFAYSNLLGFGVFLIRRGAADPQWTLWLIHLTFAAAAVWLLHRRERLI